MGYLVSGEYMLVIRDVYCNVFFGYKK